MAHRSDRTFLVLHALRLKGFGGTAAVAETAGVAEADAAEVLEAAKAEAQVIHREGRITGWSLTPAGRQGHGALLAAELETGGYRDTVHEAYKRFLEINGDLLGVCTDWQMRPGPAGQPGLNAPGDPEYDAKVVPRLRQIDDGVQPVCSKLEES